MVVVASHFSSRTALLAASVLVSTLLAGCGKPSVPAQVVRPVRTVVVNLGAAAQVVEYPGEVRPRIESRLGFRVGGKIIERRVDIGQAIKAGQVLARIDAQDLKLAETAARAQLDAAETDRALADADFKRYQDLFQQNFIGKAELDRRRATLDAAQSRYEQANANFKSQANQASYSTLVADAAGVVVGIDAEVGQVVSPGTVVVRVARSNEKEVLISVPEGSIDALRRLESAQVSIWALPGRSFPAKVREIAASADVATRTYPMRLALKEDSKDIRLGMTAVAAFEAPAAAAAIRLPLSALAQRGGKTFVWVVDSATMTVNEAPVELAGPSGVDVLVARGLVPGQRVVTAGANLLQPGQKVKLLESAAAVAAGDTTQGGVAR